VYLLLYSTTSQQPATSNRKTQESEETFLRILTRVFKLWILKPFIIGISFCLGVMTMALFAVSTGIGEFTSGQTLTADALNGLRTAVESIPNWQKNGTILFLMMAMWGLRQVHPFINLMSVVQRVKVIYL
jgi:hypothetical protein